MSFLPIIQQLRERWYGPLLLTLALLVSLGGLLYLLENRQVQATQERLQVRSTLALQGMVLQLKADRDHLVLLAQGVSRGMIDIASFEERVTDYVKANPELEAISWLDHRFQGRWIDRSEPLSRWLRELPEPRRAAEKARETLSPVYSLPFQALDKKPALLLAVPIQDQGRFLGVLEGFYDLEALLRYTLPVDFLESYRVCLEDLSGGVPSVCSSPKPSQLDMFRTYSLALLGSKVQVRISPFELPRRTELRLLILAAVALALGLGWGMWVLQRDMRLRKRAESDLHHHLNLLQTILAATPDSVSVRDLEGQYRLINRTGAKRFGRPAHEIVGRTVEAVMDADLARIQREEDRTALQEGRSLTREQQYELDGRRRTVLSTRTPYRDDAGAISGLVEVGHDISALKETETELRKSERRFRSVFESSAVGIALIDQEGLLLQVNPQFADFVGGDSKELVGKTFASLVASNPQELSWKGPWRPEISPLEMEIQFLRQDGIEIWGHVSATAIEGHGGRPPICLAMVQNIDDRKQAEVALLESEERYRMLFAAGSDPILVFDARNGAVVEANTAAEELFGYPAAVFCTLKVGELFEESPTGKTEPLNLLSHELRRVPLAELLRSDGNKVPVEITAGRFVWQGRPMTVAIVRDITEQQELEKMKDDMLSSVSHEMRTPLTAMMGFVEFLLENEVERDQQQQFLEIIVKETHRLKELIDNLLNLQRLRAGVVPLREDIVSVEALFHDLLALFEPSSPDHFFRLDYADHLPPIQADEGQIFQALRNLVTNAIKYSPEGGAVILGARKREDGLHLWVRDEGLGIPPADLDRIFDRFYRVSDDGHQKIGGTGLGLPLVKEIIHQHGGEVWAESDGETGSTFHLRLPVLSVPAAANQAH